MPAEDVLAQSLGIELLRLNIISREALLGVRDVDAAIGATLHSREDTGTGRRPSETDIKEHLERPTGLSVIPLGSLGQRELSIGLFNAFKLLVEAELLQSAAGDQEADAVCSSPVGEAVCDAIAFELVSIGGAEDLVASELRSDDLADDVAVRESDNEAVLGGVVFVLRLGYEPLAGVVVCLACSSALWRF